MVWISQIGARGAPVQFGGLTVNVGIIAGVGVICQHQEVVECQCWHKRAAKCSVHDSNVWIVCAHETSPPVLCGQLSLSPLT